ncbi:DUF4352 domain-containing protein [Nocardiopsis sp. EMB25]|uniref:DUF4352 domain-containing protein n=1 Tax=Nocardiopsis sp. EMB25 TaxID=2835867 RepID=UPI002283DBD4|nr:DUF4352 domain-containing protein [Nocardiopsis sp. EMB25]MCY9784592.1 DUF4352 domain-containing protein [Nocardiopsis sp. EMB25]
MSTGAKIGIGCGVAAGAVVALLVALVVVGGMLVRNAEPTPAQPPEAFDPSDFPTPDVLSDETVPASDTTVGLTAAPGTLEPSFMFDDGDYVTVEVTVVNNTDEPVSVASMYFTLVDDGGEEHVAGAGLLMDADDIDVVELAPGQEITGNVSSSGTFTPVTVQFQSGSFGTTYTAPVA